MADLETKQPKLKIMVRVAELESARANAQQIFFPLYVTIADFSLWAGLCLDHIITDLGRPRIVSTHSQHKLVSTAFSELFAV